MRPKAMDSLDIVEAVILIEQVFETEIPSNDAEHFGGPREIVDWLELHLSNQRPNKQATALLIQLARDHNNPEWLKAWKGHGDENKLPQSRAKSLASRGIE